LSLALLGWAQPSSLALAEKDLAFGSLPPGCRGWTRRQPMFAASGAAVRKKPWTARCFDLDPGTPVRPAEPTAVQGVARWPLRRGGTIVRSLRGRLTPVTLWRPVPRWWSGSLARSEPVGGSKKDPDAVIVHRGPSLR